MKVIRIGVTILLLLGYATLFADVKKHPERSVGGVPVQVLKWADECVAERYGTDVVNESVFLVGWELNPTGYQACHLISFEFRPEAYPWVNLDFVVCVDSVGDCVGVYGYAPDCSADPTLCEFPISKEQAAKIAREGGLEPGITDWAIELQFSGDKRAHRRLNWHITSFVDDRVAKTAVVDSYTGELLEIKEGESADPFPRCVTDSVWAARPITPVTVITHGRIEYREAPRATAKVLGLLRHPTKLVISDYVAGYCQTVIKRKTVFIAVSNFGYQSDLAELHELAICHLKLKYGERDGSRIARGSIWEGMTTDMARDSWGEPLRAKKQMIPIYKVTRERWVYEHCFLDFEKDRLCNIERY